jgi:hypothetical protein
VTAAIGRRSEAPAQAVSIGLGADPVGTRRSELRRLSGADPLELTYRNEVVVGVTEPAWAARLQPQQWVGTGLEQMITVLTTAVGSPLRSDIDALEGGVHRCEFRYGDGAQEEVLLAYYVPPAADPEQSAILLVPVGAG